MSPVDIAVVASSVVVVLGGIVGWYAKGRPKWRRFWSRLDGTFDAINGREPYVDAASGRHVPALSPLTTRVANVEEAIVRLTRFEERMTAVEGRVENLEKAREERLATQLESAHMWKAVAEADTDLVRPEDDDSH